MRNESLWKWSAWGLAAAALLMSLDTWLSAPRLREIIRRKIDHRRRIEAQAHRWALEEAWRQQLEQQQAWTPADLEELAVRYLGVGAARISPRPAVPALAGWQGREVTVEMSEVSFAEAGLFLAAAAQSLPPWRVRELEFRASAVRGRGAMSLVLVALEKRPP